MTVIGVDAIIKGYDKRPRYISFNARLDKLNGSGVTIQDLVAMCVQGVTGLNLEAVLENPNTYIEINDKPVELDDGLNHHITSAPIDYLGAPQIRLLIEKPAF